MTEFPEAEPSSENIVTLDLDGVVVDKRLPDIREILKLRKSFTRGRFSEGTNIAFFTAKCIRGISDESLATTQQLQNMLPTVFLSARPIETHTVTEEHLKRKGLIDKAKSLLLNPRESEISPLEWKKRVISGLLGASKAGEESKIKRIFHIDDNLEIAQALTEIGPQVIVFWLKKRGRKIPKDLPENIKVVTSLKEAVDYLEKEIKE